MRNVRILLPIILIISACTLPSSVEIKWSPDITIPSTSNFSNMLQNNFMSYIKSSEDLTIIPCENENTIMAFALHMPIIGKDTDALLLDCLTNVIASYYKIPLDDVKNITDSEWNKFPPIQTDDIPLFGKEEDDPPVHLSLADLVEVLDGFFYKTIEAKFYTGDTGDTGIINSLRIELNINSKNSSIHIPELNSDKLSGFDNNWKICTWTELPEGGSDANKDEKLKNMINKQEDIEIRYKVYLKKGSKISQRWFSNPQVRTEMVMILPLHYTVDPDKGEADFIFPNLFGESDMFGRNDGDDSNAIQYLEFNIKFTHNAFGHAELHVRSDKGDIEVKRKCNDAEMNIVFNDDDMILINSPENFPFVPKMWYHFTNDDELIIPRDFKTTELNFKAKIFYNIGLD